MMSVGTSHRRSVIRTLCVLAFGAMMILICRPAEALDPARSISQFHQTVWTPKNGAPADVWAMAQSADGWLWFGGPDGLYRFDGIAFEWIDVRGRQTQRSQSISALYAMPSGGLLIGYVYGGVSVMRDGALTHYGEAQGLGADTIFSLAQDADGTLWAASRKGLMRSDGKHWQRVDEAWNVPDSYASSVFVDQAGTVWVAAEAGILRRDRDSRSFQKIESSSTVMAEIIQSPDGRTWYANERGVHLLTHLPPQSGRAPSVNSRASYGVMFDGDGALWVLAEEGLLRVGGPEAGPMLSNMRRKLAEHAPLIDASKMYGTKTILEDREGNVWLTTIGAIHRFRDANIQRFAPTTNQPPLVSFAAGNDGTTWMAAVSSSFLTSSTDGIWRFDGRLQRVQASEITSASSVHQGGDGRLWVGGRQGIWRYDGSRFAKAFDLPEVARGKLVQSLAGDVNGDLWVSVLGAGLFRHRGGTWQRNGGIAQLPDELPTVQTIDPTGRLWLGYGNSAVFSLDDGAAVVHRSIDGLDIGSVMSISVGRNTIAGGERGTAVLIDGRFHALRTREARALERVNGIVQTESGDIWLNGSMGAVRIAADDMATFLQQHAKDVAIEVFDSGDGYPGSGTSAMQLLRPSMLAAPDGRIWLNGTDGIGWIEPAQIRRNRTSPLVLVRSWAPAGNRRDGASEIALPAGERSLKIDYTALSYSQPERLHFRYRLVGVDESWVDADTRRQAFYTNLSPGRYEFEVIAANENNIWSPSPASLVVTIPPTFVQSTFFLVLCVMAVVALLIALYQLRVRQVTARERSRLEERLGERERIARELHDTLLQSTQGLILQVHAAARQFPTGDPMRTKLENAIERADAVTQEGRDRVLDLRVPAETMSDLPHALAAAGEELAQGRDIAFRMVAEGKERALAPPVKDAAFRIAREALINAFAHAQARSIEVQLIYDEDLLRVRVRDDGVGIDPAALASGSRPGHWGLQGMHERAKAIDAGIQVWSRDGAGTEIELTVPARSAYQKSNSALRWFRPPPKG